MTRQQQKFDITTWEVCIVLMLTFLCRTVNPSMTVSFHMYIFFSYVKAEGDVTLA